MPTCVSGPQVYLGEQYVNNLTLSDVTFLVEGQTFHAHRIALLASSDTFRAMFDGHYKEKEASTIPIPNIRYCVFESMMRCIYTGETPMRMLLSLLLPCCVANLPDRICGNRFFLQWLHACTCGVLLRKGASQECHAAAVALCHAAWTLPQQGSCWLQHIQASCKWSIF